jgi:hypothetical protein
MLASAGVLLTVLVVLINVLVPGSGASREDLPTSQATIAPTTPTLGPEHPFVGSPAEQWSSGADAITLPAATAAGSFTVSQVSAALATSKQLLVTAFLDPRILRGDTSAFYAMLHGHALADVRDWLAKNPQYTGDDFYYTTLASGVTLDVPDIRVHGQLTVRTESRPNGLQALIVRGIYVFAYALRQGSTVGVVIRRVTSDMFYYDPNDVHAGDAGPYPDPAIETYCAGPASGGIYPVATANPPRCGDQYTDGTYYDSTTPLFTS